MASPESAPDANCRELGQSAVALKLFSIFVLPVLLGVGLYLLLVARNQGEFSALVASSVAGLLIGIDRLACAVGWCPRAVHEPASRGHRFANYWRIGRWWAAAGVAVFVMVTYPYGG